MTGHPDSETLRALLRSGRRVWEWPRWIRWLVRVTAGDAESWWPS